MINSPLNLEILLIIYYGGNNNNRFTAEGLKKGRQFLYDNGLIDRNDEHCVITDKGSFFVKHLLSVPFPVINYSIPSKEEMIEEK